MGKSLKRRWEKFKGNFILDKKKRRQYREDRYRQTEEGALSQARWGVSYSVFDGEELLEQSLKSIRDEADYINVVYQLHSWYGNPADEGLLPLLNKLKREGLIDELAEYAPDLSARAGTNERRKRNIGLKMALAAGCNYFMTMDCDEFYLTGQVAQAKKIIIAKNITNSYCPQTYYGYDPTRRLVVEQIGYVPFFARITKSSKLTNRINAPCSADKSRIITKPWNGYERVLGEVFMHHMNLIRKNILKKYENTSFANREIKLQPPDISSIPYITVDNVFNIPLEAINSENNTEL